MSVSKLPKPPKAIEIPASFTVHGDRRIDEYAWMRERKDPRVLRHLRRENAFLDAVFRPHSRIRRRILSELKSRIRQEDESVPAPYGGFLYFHRLVRGKQHKIYFRKGKPGGGEELLLDLNIIARRVKYLSLGAFEVSPDHGLLAYSLDTDGSERHTIRIKDLSTGRLLSDRIDNADSSLAWADDNRTFFYVALDRNLRPYRLMRHVLGTPARLDRVVYQERDPRFFVDVSRSCSGRFLFLNISGNVTDEIRVLASECPRGRFCILVPRKQGVEVSADHSGDKFYLVTNRGARNFRVVSAPSDETRPRRWKSVVRTSPDRLIEGIEAFGEHLVVYERFRGLPRIRIVDLRRGGQHTIRMSGSAYTVDGGTNLEFDTEIFRFEYESMVLPRCVFDYNMRTKRRVLRKEYKVPSGYDPRQYSSERIYSRAKDGSRVPVSLVYRRGFRKDGVSPLHLTGYGAYGHSLEAGFSGGRISLLDRGFVVAIAHVRGGSELGRDWYERGKMVRKENTFSDFIAVSEHLIRRGYTSPDRLVISGGSAGGMLIGVVVNRRPDLFRGAVAHVPFVDVLNTMLDRSLPLTAMEYDEWGNPSQRAAYFRMKRYSPYDNVRRGSYPSLLVTAGLNDPRVTYWEPAKWVARLRARKTDSNLILLRTNLSAGHKGVSGRYDVLREVAMEYTFLCGVLQLAP